jgi:hypothetical protein
MRYGQHQREGSMMKRISKWLVALAVVFSISGTFMSAANSQAVTLMTPRSHNGGEVGCGRWLETRAERVRLGDQAVLQESFYRLWVLGFLSGVARERSLSDGADLLRGTEASGLMAWLDNYCRENPLENLLPAVMRLINHLEARAR